MAMAVQEAGLESDVTLLPPTDSSESLYRALDVLVTSSLLGEGFQNVVGEALARGVPAVVRDGGDAASVVGETGIVSKSSSPDLLGGGAISDG